MLSRRDYEIAVRRPSGALIDLISSEYICRWTLRANKTGVLVLELPSTYCSSASTFSIADFSQDCRIELRRFIDGSPTLVGRTCWFVVYIGIIQDANGQRKLRLEAESALGLAGRRTIAYKSNDNASDLEFKPADNQLLRVMRDHFSEIATSYNYPDSGDLGDDPDPEPLRTAIAPYMTINYPPGPGLSTATVEMNVAHQPVLQALGRIADASFAKGEPLFFDIQQLSNTTNPFLEFITKRNQLGVDRTATTGGSNAITIDDTMGVINEYTFALDWRESAYRVYAGSQGRGEDQAFRTIDDPRLVDIINGTGAYAAIGPNPFALREAYIGTNELAVDVAKLDDQAHSELTRVLPKIDVQGKLSDSETFRWGVDWDYGDRLTVITDGVANDVFIETLEGELNDGRETITATFATSLHRNLEGIARVVQDTKRNQWWIKHLNALEAA